MPPVYTGDFFFTAQSAPLPVTPFIGRWTPLPLHHPVNTTRCGRARLLMSVEQRFDGGDVMSVRMGVPLLILALALAACGTTTGDRGLSGAGIGAATGAVVGAVVGGPVLAASAIGAGAGALAGAVTTPNQVDLGKPVWEH